MSKFAEIDQNLLKLCKSLFDVNSYESLAESKSMLISSAFVVFVAVHLCFASYFAYLGIGELITFNSLSIAFYVALLLLRRSKRISLDATLVLSITEVCAHSLVASYFIGWESGFSVYPIAVSAMIICFSGRSLMIFFATVALILGTIIASDTLFYHQQPVYLIDPALVSISRKINYAFALMALSLAAIYLHFQLGSVDSSLQRLAQEDQLTGLHNRRAMSKHAEKTLRTCFELRAPVCVAIGDIDHFKKINDTYGHAIGDLILANTAQLLDEQRREKDLLARWGGEEFAWVLPNSTLTSAYNAMERTRMAVEAMQTETGKGGLNISLTIGVVQLLPGEDFDSAIDRADHALYLGKNKGRNQVNIALPTHSN